jgi:hypothetical protein
MPPGWYPAHDGPYDRWWDGHQWTNPTRPLGGAATERKAGPSAALPRTTGWLIAGFGVLTLIGAVLPWATIGVFSAAGTEGDGTITLVLGLVAAAGGVAQGLVRHPSAWSFAIPGVCLLLGFAILAVGVYDVINISSNGNDDTLFGPPKVGSGLILTVVAGAGIVGSAALALGYAAVKRS